MTIQSKAVQTAAQNDPVQNGTIQDALRHFIETDLLAGQNASVSDDENLLLSGLVDSLGMLRLTGFIEERFGYRVPPEDVIIENFSTIDVIAHYLEQHASSLSQ